ncbi:aldo/keto reductase [Phycicoccus sp. Root563]|uniref:aldo/keto reductase n=1 Tax=unclassified Phycicoccus TaxID=2637926 RepID=UPI0007026645|nr:MULTISPECIES: aldo/keto reductase [unclassified Phycicoccus]KQU68633.1 aldo/keto reductase [Phycicoccus sp. Root101]KQZ88125.1 aldo/keto reductase [Phycicoccus sp. Root563]
MRQRRMGTSGLSVSRLALGTMTWGRTTDEENAREQLRTFLDAGGNLLDTAHGYSDGAAEEIIGRLMGDAVDREDVMLCTKSGISRRSGQRVVDTSRHSLLRQLDTSLERLGTDHVDLWLVHTWSDEAPLTETLSALEWAVATGRARYVGVSNFSGWQSARAFSLLEQARVPLVANEVEYSLVNRNPEPDLLEAAQALGFGILPWSPLGRGVLTGKYRHGIPADSRAASRDFPRFTARYLDDRSTNIVEALAIAAKGLEVSTTEVALAWVRDRPGVVSPVVGARTTAQLRTSLASEQLELPAELVAALDEVSD